MHVTVLINYLSHHQVPVFEAFQDRVGDFEVLVSVEVEPQRPVAARFGRLSVIRQRAWTFHPAWRHVAGFRDRMNVHVPYDTLAWLWRLAPQVVVSYELGMRSLLSTLFCRLRPRTRLVLVQNLSERTEQNRGPVRRLLRHHLLRRAQVVTCNGASARRYLESLGVPAQRIHHFPYCADPASIHRGPVRRPAAVRRRLLWVGQLSERKNAFGLWRALARWCAPRPGSRVRMTVVGEGSLEPSLRSEPLPAGLEIDFVGTRTPEQMPAIWAEHGVLVFPTLADEWGMVLEEALHSGLPVLASRHAQSAALVIEGFNGWCFDPDDARDFDQAVERMMSASEETLDRMAACARASVAGRSPAWAASLLLAAIPAVSPRSDPA